jgi:S-DNA-T family DNA segregation ATPase FtsK/SpoIIIE
MARNTRRPRAERGSRTGRATWRGSTNLVTGFGRLLTRPELVGTLLVVLAAATLPFLLPLAGLIADGRDELVRLLGLHVFSLVVVFAAAGVLIGFRWTGWISRHSRHLIGAIALLGLSAGILGFWYPDRTVGDIDLAVHSAGGDLGRVLASWPIGLAIWLLLGLAGFALLWPKTAAAILQGMPDALGRVLQWLWNQHLHRPLGRGLRLLFTPIARLMNPRRDLDPEFTAAPSGSPNAAEAVVEIAGPASPELAAAVEAAATEAQLPPEDAEQRRATQIVMDMETPADQLRHSQDGWQLPPVSLLNEEVGQASRAVDNARRAALIVDTLDSFGVDASVVQINEGPTVTQFGVEPGWDVKSKLVAERDATGRAILDDDGQPITNEVEVSRTRIRVNRITALQNDLALALAAPALRIEAPVPGKPMVGIEVPNANTSTVSMRGIIESNQYQRSLEKFELPIALGAGVSGDPVIADLSTMPHVLIAGATGSGKSVCLNAIISGLLMHRSPDQLRLVMIDPKRVELADFAAIPHLAFSRIVVEMDQVVGTLQAVINEMESRYRKFAKAGVRNIKTYNKKAAGRSAMPYWVVVIDELADLMIAAPYQVEQQLVRLAQLARATGIHLVVATQRPSVDVITGLIKANFPTRVAFAVASAVDSRTVLDHGGAEKLLGRGDMLYVPPDEQNPKRVQGVFVSDEEIRAIVNFWTADRFASLQPDKFDDMLLAAEREVEEHGVDGSEDDPLIAKAIELAKDHKTLSTSMLQRKLRIGYPRAARTMDELEDRGIIAAGDGSSSREVLIGPGAAPEGRSDEGHTLAAEAADFEPVTAGAPPEVEAEERDPDNRKLIEFPKAFDED